MTFNSCPCCGSAWWKRAGYVYDCNADCDVSYYPNEHMSDRPPTHQELLFARFVELKVEWNMTTKVCSLWNQSGMIANIGWLPFDVSEEDLQKYLILL